MPTPPASFHLIMQGWQNFYLLTGTAAATLTGLMFIAITFGSSLVTKQSVSVARAFIDPTYTHFVQVLLTACIVTIPTLSATLLGAILLLATGARGVALVWVFGQIKKVHRTKNDIETSDWLIAIVFPTLAYSLLLATGVGFLIGWPGAFSALAIANLGLLCTGIVSAWELVVWMAVTVGDQGTADTSAPAKAPADRAITGQ